MTKPIYQLSTYDNLPVVALNSATALPDACGFLWHKRMMLQMNCRGYADVQYLDPEPSKYSVGPMLEAQTFIQPEQAYYTDHPGRFFYLKNHQTNDIISIPYEPCRNRLDSFRFEQHDNELKWYIEHWQLSMVLTVRLIGNEPVEHWQLSVINQSEQPIRLSLYSNFSIGYRSWMYQEAHFDSSLNSIVAKAIAPYQKVEQYFKNLELKELTFCTAKQQVDAWCANYQAFIGDGHLSSPDGIKAETLSAQASYYQLPTACMQFDLALKPQAEYQNAWLFGAAKSTEQIDDYQLRFLFSDTKAESTYRHYHHAFTLAGISPAFDDLASFWLPRQISYITDTNRLTTDPQTRNYLQDHLAVCYLAPRLTRSALIKACSQQLSSGAMPDGILLHENASLKYINQVPHADHGVWLPLVLQGYLDETNDSSLLLEPLNFADQPQSSPIFEHIERALDYLLAQRDHRGLSYIEQGDWCDPMNMVGYQGKGVSSWLTLATAYSIKVWCDIAEHYIEDYDISKLTYYQQKIDELNHAVNQYCWYQTWYGRGITDEGRLFGTSADIEGKMYLNPQTWALLTGAVSSESAQVNLIEQIEQQLATPFGMMMLAPAYTQMQTDIGRLTQKYPGTAENGSVYNHAAAFYAYSLYQINQADKAFEVLQSMLPTLDDVLIRGQLPTFIPNYYRGAYQQLPNMAGRSSQLINTGTCAWVMRCIIEQLCGLKGQAGCLVIHPKLPKHINKLHGVRHFMDARFNFTIERAEIANIRTWLNGVLVLENCIKNIEADQQYQLNIQVPYG